MIRTVLSKSIIFCMVFFGIYLPSPILSEESDLDFSGHIKLRTALVFNPEDSVSREFGPSEGFLHDYNIRPRISYNNKAWLLNLEGEVNGIGGSAKSGVEAALFGRPLLENDDRRFFNLSTREGDSSFSRTSRIDRILVGYNDSGIDLRLGRQSYSYGQGLSFSVLDVFNPFSPVAYDTEFKIGEDMFTLRFEPETYFSAGLIAVGRRNENGSVLSDESSFAFHASCNYDSFEWNVILSRHYGGDLIGGGLSYSFLGAMMRSDFSINESSEGKYWSDFLVNIDRGFIFLDHNLYFFLEYFYSGLGLRNTGFTTDNAQGDLEGGVGNALLFERLRRGELFTFGRQYIGFGGSVEFSERLKFLQFFLVNIDDQSRLIRPFFEFDLDDSKRIRFGALLFGGSTETEFGGFTQAGFPAMIKPGNQLFLQFANYF
ncbi:MAG TPA: hypothetical protein PKA63_05380 [Oligoflexia bacterium]|nr:hypothetical protein [Oligoflexia bacterium]HMP48080.1 hypothetical protein [Oligoflexia bacterium]